MSVRTFVIAEPGCTAQGDLATMLRQIDMVAECGVDAFKGQWTSSAERMVARRHAPAYLRAYRWLEWPAAWHEQLQARCALRGIEYLCTVYLPEDVTTVAPFVSRFKISSFEAMDAEFVRAHFPFKKPIILSIGLTVNWDEIPEPDEDWFTGMTVLQCTSAYPCPWDQLNLALLRRPDVDGLSDHSDPKFTWIGAIAVAAGAKVIETHVRLNDCDPANPDYAVARDHAELRDYIAKIRIAELALGDGVKKIEPAERSMLRHRVTA